MTVPLSDGAFGPITVRTAGGTSAAYSVSLTGIGATALSGTPADAGQASANPGQAVTLGGSGLTTASDFLLRYVDYNGDPAMVRLNPSAAAADGTQRHAGHPRARQRRLRAAALRLGQPAAACRSCRC